MKLIITGEKVKVSGLSLLSPGVNYNIEILNEEQEAVQELRSKYWLVDGEVETILMKVE